MTVILVATLLACTPKVADSGRSDTGEDAPSVPPKDTSEPPDIIDEIDGSSLPAGVSPCREPVKGEVVEVTDGDTIRVKTGRGVERVRLIGIDTPEVDHSGPDDECFGEEAKAFLTAMIEDKRVWLTFDAECKDGYDRTLAYVHRGLETNDFAQRLLLRGGWATAYAVSPNVSLRDLFEADEAAARDASEGLWGECT